jgi:hypothetical protein
MPDLIGWVFFFAVALVGWAVIVLGTIRSVKAMRRARWHPLWTLLAAVVAAQAMVLVWPFYAIWRLSAATYRNIRPTKPSGSQRLPSA